VRPVNDGQGAGQLTPLVRGQPTKFSLIDHIVILRRLGVRLTRRPGRLAGVLGMPLSEAARQRLVEAIAAQRSAA
jgi:hypothetical protein